VTRASGCGRVAAALVALLGGCGYSAGPLTRRVERRVHLPMFENRTYYRDLELDLTRQVEKELASRPGISIVPPERADIVLAGTIVDFKQHVLSEDPQDRVRESSVITYVRMEVRDPRSGAIRRAYELSDRAEFLTQRGETLATAAAESFFDLARRIVDGLEDDFPHASAAARGETK
jgi:outer membrane lipopolysaccharide assembly protein LptE/RlpB